MTIDDFDMDLVRAIYQTSGHKTPESFMEENARIARAFPAHRRRWTQVPWSAYVAVADLTEEEQDMLLDYHEANGCFPGGEPGRKQAFH